MSTLARRLYHVEGRLQHIAETEDAATVREAYVYIEALKNEMTRMLDKLRGFSAEHSDPGPDCLASIYCAEALLQERMVTK